MAGEQWMTYRFSAAATTSSKVCLIVRALQPSWQVDRRGPDQMVVEDPLPGA